MELHAFVLGCITPTFIAYRVRSLVADAAYLLQNQY